VTWNRAKDENDIKHEVRYAFSDIHQIDWNAAKPALRGIITPPGWQGYNGMVYDTTALPLAGRSVVYIAIKPKNSRLFSPIAIPLLQRRSADTDSSRGPGERKSSSRAVRPPEATTTRGRGF
jgi:hypothetical protein